MKENKHVDRAIETKGNNLNRVKYHYLTLIDFYVIPSICIYLNQHSKFRIKLEKVYLRALFEK